MASAASRHPRYNSGTNYEHILLPGLDAKAIPRAIEEGRLEKESLVYHFTRHRVQPAWIRSYNSVEYWSNYTDSFFYW